MTQVKPKNMTTQDVTNYIKACEDLKNFTDMQINILTSVMTEQYCEDQFFTNEGVEYYVHDYTLVVNEPSYDEFDGAENLEYICYANDTAEISRVNAFFQVKRETLKKELASIENDFKVNAASPELHGAFDRMSKIYQKELDMQQKALNKTLKNWDYFIKQSSNEGQEK